jgi:uncharacterized protein (TIGR03435 family)
MNMSRHALAAIFLSGAAFSQTPPPREFEVASIRQSAPFNGRVNLHVQIDGSQLHCTFFSLKDLLTMAYKVKDYQVLGPSWLASERFDISAKLPEGAARPQVTEMMQALLAERFKVKLHRDSKEFPVYALMMAKSGVKMKESLNAPPSAEELTKTPISVSASGGREGTTVDLGHGSYFTIGNNKLEARKLQMAALADMLARFVDRPVVDMTELKGNYDFSIEFSPEDFRAMMIRSAITAGVTLPPEALRLIEGGPGDSLFTAMQSVGLKLDRRKAPLEVIVVDEASKTPTEN